MVWNWLKRRPFSANWEKVGVSIAPPKGSVAPKPMSSMSTITTLGAPSGGVMLKGGGAVTLRASSSVMGAATGGWMGSDVRSKASPCAIALPSQPIMSASPPLSVNSESFFMVSSQIMAIWRPKIRRLLNFTRQSTPLVTFC